MFFLNVFWSFFKTLVFFLIIYLTSIFRGFSRTLNAKSETDNIKYILIGQA